MTTKQQQDAMISFGDTMLPAKIDIETTPIIEETMSLEGFNDILRDIRKKRSIEISGKLTINDIDTMFDTLRQSTMSSNNDYYILMSPKTYFWLYWAYQYALQGKRYPSMRKRRSKARMAKRWRFKA